MRALFVTSEVYPLAKTGGLADVSAALPAALRALGIDVRILVPGYPEALAGAVLPQEIARLADLPGCGEARLLETHLPGTRVPVWLIDCPRLYNRAGGLYQDASGAEWPDNALRFGALNHAAAAIAAGAAGAWRPDLIHANDWHAGLIPLLLEARGGKRPATLLTIHNLAFQGLFDPSQFAHTGLPDAHFAQTEFWGRISFLKAGICGADAITAVSPTYAREILGPDHGCGMDGLLRERAAALSGILNGADYALWNPADDPRLPSSYSARSLAGKALCKRALQAELGLETKPDAPLMAFMSRLAHQKMPDVVLEALPALIEAGMQFVLLARGEPHYEAGFARLAETYPGRVAVRIGYHEDLAHRLLAGADMAAHPARFEPCGLVPIYAMRYGAVPIVRKAGGMADSVVHASAQNLREGSATGFAFEGTSAEDFAACARRALALYAQPILWRRLQAAAMARDLGWARSAEAYAALYRALVGAPAAMAAEPRSTATA
jgi:starch synthase